MHDDFIPAEGRAVVYQVAPGQFRPAQIVRVWSETGLKTCNLVVFLDGTNDAGLPCAVGRLDLASTPTLWKTSVPCGEGVGEYLPRKPVDLLAEAQKGVSAGG